MSHNSQFVKRIVIYNELGSESQFKMSCKMSYTSKWVAIQRESWSESWSESQFKVRIYKASHNSKEIVKWIVIQCKSRSESRFNMSCNVS